MNNQNFKYRWWKVVAYEITILLINNNKKWEIHPIVKMIRDECIHDWTKYKTQKTMDQLDEQIESVISYYEGRRRKIKFEHYSVEEGETPLGGELRASVKFIDEE